MQKGQVSFEFIITIIIVLGIFVFSFALFNNRASLNTGYAELWQAKDTAQKIARTIDAVSVMDANSSVTDYVYWQGTGKSITLSGTTLTVWYNTTSLITETVFADANWLVTDVNGPLVFEKKGTGVEVRNQ